MALLVWFGRRLYGWPSLLEVVLRQRLEGYLGLDVVQTFYSMNCSGRMCDMCKLTASCGSELKSGASTREPSQSAC